MANGQHEKGGSSFWMASGLYDVLKWIALIFLPALNSAYFGLAQLWHWANTVEVMGTIAIVDTLLGALLQISKSSYNRSSARFDGAVEVVPDHENETTDMNVRLQPASLETKDELVLKVNRLP